MEEILNQITSSYGYRGPTGDWIEREVKFDPSKLASYLLSERQAREALEKRLDKLDKKPVLSMKYAMETGEEKYI